MANICNRRSAHGVFVALSMWTAMLGSACNAPTSPTGAAPATASRPRTAPPASPPIPTPPQYTATPAPFDLTQSQSFDILGWDAWPSAPTQSTVQFRWNAAISKYEVLAPGYADWNRLEALQDLQSGAPRHHYDVFASDGPQLPFSMIVVAPPNGPPADGYVGNARIFERSFARAYFAFGMATQPSDLPISGTMTCSFGEDEIGEGVMTIDPAAGTLAGWVRPFWVDIRYELVQASVTPGSTSFNATFGIGGVIEGRFFGPRGVNIAVRAKGGGQGFVVVSGIMTGVCER